jgi:hypothetical protein
MTILDGKPLYNPVWNLKILAQPEFAIDYDQRYSADKQNDLYPGTHFPFENLELIIRYDQTQLATHCFADNSPIVINQNFADNTEFCNHELTIELKGADVYNNFLLDRRIITLGVNIELFIEGIDLTWYLDNNQCFLSKNNGHEYGRKFMTENGRQTIDLQTPIYCWLINHQNFIVNQYCQNSCKNQ